MIIRDQDYPTVISFYTKTWQYQKHAERLKRECDRLGLASAIEERRDSGSWLANTRLKPEFILQKLVELKKPVLWLDVDASIRSLPLELSLPMDCDFMGVHQRIGPRRTWHVGTMVFNYSTESISLLERWVESTITGSDEASFEDVWCERASKMGVSHRELPPSYFCIPEVSYNMVPDPIIIHRLSKCESKMVMKRAKIT